MLNRPAWLLLSAAALVAPAIGAAVTFSNASTASNTITAAPGTAALSGCGPPDALGCGPYTASGTTWGTILSNMEQYMPFAADPSCPESSSAWSASLETGDIVSTIFISPHPTTGWWTIVPNSNVVVTIPGNPSTANPYSCCGSCGINWGDIVIKYWPASDAYTGCLATETSVDLVDGPTFTQRDLPATKSHKMVPFITQAPLLPRADNGAPVTAIGADGFVYTSPYVYVEALSAGAADMCGLLGKRYYNLTWSFEASELTTLAPIASCYTDGATATTGCQTSSPFNPGDLPCGPASVTSLSSFIDIWLPGQQYAPYFFAPPEVTALDPNWKGCLAGNGQDPFQSLTPYAALATPTQPGVVASPPPEPAPTPASPAPLPTSAFDPGPAKNTMPTADPANKQLPSSPPVAMTPASDLPTDPSPNPSPNPSPHDPSDPQQPSDPSPQQPSDPKLQDPSDPSPQDPSDPSPQDPSDPSPQDPSDPQNPSPNDPPPTLTPLPPADPAQPSQSVHLFTVGSHTITSSAGTLVVAGTTITPGAPAITVDGTPVSLPPTQAPAANPPAAGVTMDNGPAPTANGPSAIVIGHSTFALPTLAPAAAPFTADGATFAPLLTTSGGGLLIDGSSVLLPGSALTIDGSVFSLASDDQALVLGGSSTLELSVTTQTPDIGGIVWSALGGTGPAVAVATETGTSSGSGSPSLTSEVVVVLGTSGTGAATQTIAVGAAAGGWDQQGKTGSRRSWAAVVLGLAAGAAWEML